ncbi:hypothetical protein COU16_00020 [Candidatus Kaiserbacteria bacterium CG10_big_fil_rev_8_21_14_0_10_47_16]|uniref:DUF2127 domain-containing protein n=1 Tax=Candidatus Kaiserbacteria bacterium CG10_big_fil_rev_8_21_14_0_10_47_16 TaxID=1974608 RepID=A0A2H0UEQ0_9BACT|nr:MAG: hypothetical protein COU16_00020 [Candidatus Kaiserbacteria bacterium CG10_big_fil_rev_8_21_14_0_10_47_16]
MNIQEKVEETFLSTDVLSDIFHISLVVKMGYGVLRILLGIAFLKLHGWEISTLVYHLLSYEVAEDPGDLLVGIVNVVLIHMPVTVSYFLAFYFIFWGLFDTVLSYFLFLKKKWAYPTAFALIGTFGLYEIIRFLHNHSIILFCVILVDILILILMVREYRRLFVLKIA